MTGPCRTTSEPDVMPCTPLLEDLAATTLVLSDIECDSNKWCCRPPFDRGNLVALVALADQGRRGNGDESGAGAGRRSAVASRGDGQLDRTGHVEVECPLPRRSERRPVCRGSRVPCDAPRRRKEIKRHVIVGVGQARAMCVRYATLQPAPRRVQELWRHRFRRPGPRR